MKNTPPVRGVLVSRLPETLGAQLVLTDDELTLGRADENSVVLGGSQVSRHHARLTWTGSTYIVHDLDSKNGTWVNERRVETSATLANGDLLRFADRPFVFNGENSATLTMRVALTGRSTLVTILFTDIAGSAALRQRLGDDSVQQLVRTHDRLVRSALNEHDGQEIKHTGDGIMASFRSAFEALECAIAIQRATAEHAREQGDSELAIHAGLNAGEPIAEGIDLFGTAVDLARRICDEATPDQILASSVVKELAAGKGFQFVDRGSAALKGFQHPVRLYKVVWDPEKAVGGPVYPDGLTEREVEVLRLLAAGRSNQEIADELVISFNTVARHVSHIYRRTGAANRAEAASYASRYGLVD